MNNVDSIKRLKVNRLTATYKRSFNRIKVQLPPKNKSYNKIISLSLIALSLIILWYCFSQTYIYNLLALANKAKNQSILVGFQNSAELRPTGGFWGSFAVWDIKDNILNSTLSFDTNPYKQDNELLKESKVELPKPMSEMWSGRPQSFINANWSASFPQSAQTLQWYFGQGWGDKKVSAVVAISSLSLIDLLDLIGEIELPEENTVINSNNFTQVMSEKIDSEYWESEENKIINEPKTLIKELFPVIAQKTKSLPKITLYKFLIKQMKQGRILVYFNDDNLQKISQKLQVSGEIKPYKTDYLMINNANIGGLKTSLNVDQNIEYKIARDNQGLKSTLRITRIHEDLWPHHPNMNYTRIFVPVGSTLENIKLGTEEITDSVTVEQEHGRTVFGFWFNTDNGQQKTALIQYRIPSENRYEYHLSYQKQPGTKADWLKVVAYDNILFAGELDQTFRDFASR